MINSLSSSAWIWIAGTSRGPCSSVAWSLGSRKGLIMCASGGIVGERSRLYNSFGVLDFLFRYHVQRERSNSTTTPVVTALFFARQYKPSKILKNPTEASRVYYRMPCLGLGVGACRTTSMSAKYAYQPNNSILHFFDIWTRSELPKRCVDEVDHSVLHINVRPRDSGFCTVD